jgi:hypothetical protein
VTEQIAGTAPAACVLDAAAVTRTAESIAAAQESSGQIAWFPGGRTDPWDHVESAMALDVAGRAEQAAAAYRWLCAVQNPDGSWFRGYQGAGVVDATREANFTAYLAVGVWHHFLTTGDSGFLDEIWPTLVDALGFVLGLQQPGGEILWARDEHAAPANEALLTGCASMYHSLRCALAIAGQHGQPQPDWELAATLLGHALLAHPASFAPRERYAMDWYYPVLGGVLRGTAARERIASGWDRFVVAGLGVRCVSDRPWVTGAESAELALALSAVGERATAARLLADIQHLRHEDGSYWTGFVYEDEAIWPVERTSWTAGAVLLANAALAGDPATTAVFGAAALPAGPAELPTVCAADGCAAQHAQ